MQLTPLDENSPIGQCAIIIRVELWRNGQQHSASVMMPEKETKGHTVADVGTTIQRLSYEALRNALIASVMEEQGSPGE